MANCTGELAADIILDCEKKPIGGLEAEITLINRADILTVTKSPTNPSVVTGISLKSTKKAFKYQGFKKTANAGSDLVIADNMPDGFTHYLSLIIWGSDGATVDSLRSINDVVSIVENKNKGIAGDGAFEIYGLETGLYKTTLTKRSNDNGGTYNLEMGTQAGEEASTPTHVFFATDYATTAAARTALYTPAV